ncbi:MAG TPA: PIN domain-containing protein, partial [Acidobacteriota bacterium]
EVLVVPYRTGNLRHAESYERLLTRGRGLRLIEIDRTQLRAAAQLRAAYPALRTPDAFQLAAALAGVCTTLVTNDRSLPELPGLRVLQLSDYVE